MTWAASALPRQSFGATAKTTIGRRHYLFGDRYGLALEISNNE
jgi:hypothetical protein